MRYFDPPSPSRISEIGRRMRRERLLGSHRQVDHAKIELRRLADNLFQPRRILQTGYLHKNSAGALALNNGLDQAEFVDATLDDLDRLIDRLANALDQRGLGRGQCNQATAFGDIDTALPGGSHDAGDRLRKLAQLTHRVFGIAVTGDTHLDAVALDGAAGELNAVLPQDAQHVVADRLQLVLAHRVHIDLEQEARAALQIKPEHDVALGPGRPVAQRVFREEIRHSEKANDPCREQDDRHLPPREKQHRCDYPCYGRAAPASGLPVSSRSRPSRARPWRAPRRPSSAFGARARRRISRLRSGPRRRPW